jgi:hypothetical protein
MQGDEFGTETTEEDLQLGYKYSYKVVVEHRKILGKLPRTTLQDKVNKIQSTLTFIINIIQSCLISSINLMCYNFVLIKGATLSTNPLVLESSALIVVCNQKMVLPCSPIPLGCIPTMVLRPRHMTVIWLYFNHILNNFVVIHFVLLFFFTYTFMIVLIKFVVSMEENVVLEGHTVEEEHGGGTIPTVSTSALGK